MEFSFINDIKRSTVKSLLKQHGVSKRLLSKVKFDGGKILVNGVEENAIFRLFVGDKVTIVTPDEPDNPLLVPDHKPINILFEDEHYLIVEKPAGVLSITGVNQVSGAMSNRVKGYIQRQGYVNQTVHVITRLDRDTSGIMFFAKHRYAHALLVQSDYRDSMAKRYFAVVENDGKLPDEGEINLPIGRTEDSIIKRQVSLDDENAKACLTSYKSVRKTRLFNLLDVHLHTGRTHQIRVHFSHIGYPLIGDDLYGGTHEYLERQALHCHHLSFVHPFTEEKIEIELDMPEDMQTLLKRD